MDNCFICNEPSVGQLEFDFPNGKHFRYPFCKSHSQAMSYIHAGVYGQGYKDGYEKCLQEAKQILSKKSNLIRSLIRENKREKQLQEEIEGLRWDLDGLIDKIDKLSTNQY
ncbi:MAG: hypothetical protein A2144_02190 [Chloroflexi bacterium RBG_16_50_9]|nr:MAG: hypothetical protein A2144_02190 [Chloroflexi bacterium RBG_16_50_9]